MISWWQDCELLEDVVFDVFEVRSAELLPRDVVQNEGVEIRE
jgi:hypothetical protein